MIHQFGDSITASVGASVPSRGWAQMLATTLSLPAANSAIAGAMVLDQCDAVYRSSIVPSDVVTIMLGTNDERVYGLNASKRARFISGLSALSVYASTIAKKAASNGSYSGSWSPTVAYGIGKNSYTNGSKLSFTGEGTAIYLGYIKQEANGGTFTVKIDGILKGTFTSDGGGCSSYLGATYGAQLARFDGLSAGTHNVEVEVTSATATANRVYIDWWSSNNVAGSPAYVVNIPYATAYTSGGSNENVDLYNADISAMVSCLRADGLPVHFVGVNSLLSPTDMFDEYHPNDSGHTKIKNAVYVAMTGGITYSPAEFFKGSDGAWYYDIGSGKQPINLD